MILQLPTGNLGPRYVAAFSKAALLGTSLVLLTPFAAMADCTFGGTIGPGGAQFQNFLAATSNAATAAVTAMNTGFQTQTSAFVASPGSTQPDQFASGAWGRAIGGRMDTESMSTGEVTRRPGDLIPVTCSTMTRNDFNGVQGGYDIGRLNFGASGWNAHIGITGGFFETEATSQQGSGTTRSQVPFVGLYGVLVNGGFFIDAQLAAQFYDLNVNEPSIFAQGKMDGHGIGFTSSAGYNWQLGNGWFVEPSASVVYSSVHLDPVNMSPVVLGTLAANTPVTLPLTLALGNINTLPARVGVRVGRTFDLNGISLQPFATASVWHEFEGNTTASATFLPLNPPINVGVPGALNISSTRIGTFGQYSLGLNATLPGTGWLGYARVDYRNGENIEALSVNGGIRYQFSPTPPVVAAAAPMYTKAVKAPVAPPTWTGFYVGGFAGGAWAGDVTATEIAPGPGLKTFFNGIGSQVSYGLGASGLAGLDFGYNYQIGAMVIGAEAEGSFLHLTGSAPFATAPGTISSAKIGDWYTAFTGRLGVVAGPVLIYGKGGLAIIDVTDSVVGDCIGAACAPNQRSVAAAGGNRLGVTWAAGAGVEYALNRHWSLKGEYLALGTDASNTASGPGLKQCAGACASVPQIFNWRVDVPVVQTVKFGFNYKL